MKIAVLGVGRMGLLHARLLRRTPGIDRLLVGDADPAVVVDVITRQFGGLGLGLSIVKHIVELHGGTVDAASAGEGDNFREVLPVDQPLVV